jgi:transposase
VRDLTRLRVSLVQERTRLINRVHKVLEEAGLKLSSVRSSVMGLSGRAILHALCAGESDPQRLAELMHPSVHATQEQVVAALTAVIREHHRFLLRELLMLIDAQDRSIQHLEVEIERHLHPSARAGETLRKDQWSQPTRLAGVDGGGRNRSLPLSRCRAS